MCFGARILPMGRLDELDLSLSLSRTEEADQPWARWTLVEGESKRYARVKVVSETVAQIEAGMRARGFEPPTPISDGSGRRPKAGERRSVEASAIGSDS
ncbi:hypothetical protein BH20ACT18_BH20ACT18_01240 [soil metagenome]